MGPGSALTSACSVGALYVGCVGHSAVAGCVLCGHWSAWLAPGQANCQPLPWAEAASYWWAGLSPGMAGSSVLELVLALWCVGLWPREILGVVLACSYVRPDPRAAG